MGEREKSTMSALDLDALEAYTAGGRGWDRAEQYAALAELRDLRERLAEDDYAEIDQYRARAEAAEAEVARLTEIVERLRAGMAALRDEVLDSAKRGMIIAFVCERLDALLKEPKP
jgi:phage shock protein A